MVNKIATATYNSPCGVLVLGVIDGKLCLCDWDIPSRRAVVDCALCKFFDAEMVEGHDELLTEAARQLDEYFSGRRRYFSVTLAFSSCGLKSDVWTELQKMAYGETVSYSQVAAAIGRPNAVRAVASAIGANPISIFIPCHRVIGKSGALTGYAGGLEAKKTLLEIEQR